MTSDDGSAFEYFQRIESCFLLHRGSPLLLSPSDYRVARRWHEEGVPLDLVLRTLDEWFERRRERAEQSVGEEVPKVWGLRQVRPAVDGAWKRLRALTAPGDRRAPEGVETIDVPARVASLKAALEEALATALGEAPAARERLAARLDALAGESDPRRVEEGLGAVENEALGALLGVLGAEERAELEAQVDRALAPLAERMTRDEAEATRERLLRQRVRRRAGMPTLSLFAEAALS